MTGSNHLRRRYPRIAQFLWPRQRWPQGGLIGPTFFPVYQLALTAALGITLVFSAGVAMLGPAAGEDQGFRLVETLTALVRRCLIVFAWITLVFAVVDLSQSRLLRFTTWEPRRLPAVLKIETRISRLDSASELLLASVGLLWLLLAPPFSFLALGGAARIIELTSVWRVVYPPIVGLAAGAIVLSAINFRRPFWTPARSLARLGVQVGTLIVMVVLLMSGQVVTSKAGATLPEGQSLDKLVGVINAGCEIGFFVASVVTLVGIVREVRLLRSRRKAAPSRKANVKRAGVVASSAAAAAGSASIVPTPSDEFVDLVERYLQAVRLFLPRRQQDDAAAELAARLATQVQDLEAEIGRRLTDDERADVVRRTGHPVVVAAQYRRHERLIGPALFPIYVAALGAGLGVVLLITAMVVLLSPGQDGRSPAGRLLAVFPERGLITFAGITLICAAVDRRQLRRRADALASQEREDAQGIQRALLPSSLPGIAGCDLAVRWQPASAFGGDCYDAIRLSDTAIALSIADVCGKGLPAALVMSSLQASVRAFAQADPAPHLVVSLLNQALCRNADLRRFVTFFYGVYDANARRLTYSNAGHNPPAVVRADGSVERLTTGGMVVGVFDHAGFDQGEVLLEPGDRLVLFTDGITEAESPGGDEFGDDRLVETVVRYRSANPDGLLRSLFDEVTEFAGRHLRDDATAMAAAIR